MFSVVGDSLSFHHLLGRLKRAVKSKERKQDKQMFHSAQSHKQLCWCHVESISVRKPSPALFSQLHFLLWRRSLLYKLSEKQTNKEVYTKIQGNGMIGQWQKTTKARKYTDKCQMHPLDPSICFTTANLKDSSFLTFRMSPAVSRFEGIQYYLLLVPGVDFTSTNGCTLGVGKTLFTKLLGTGQKLTWWRNLWSCF